MRRSYSTYLAALLLLGSNGIVASNIHLPSEYIVLYRTLIGSLLLVALYVLAGNRFTFPRHRRDLLCILVSGAAMGGSWMLLYEAYVQIGVGIATLLYYCGPVIVMMLSPLVFAERLTAVKVAGFLVVLLGVWLVNGQAGGELSAFGAGISLLAAVLFAVMVMANKKSRHIVGLENTVIQLVVSFATVAVIVVCRNGLSLPAAEASDVLWIAVLGLVNTGAGCYLYFSSIGKLPVQSVAILGYIEPLSAVVLAAVLLGERMSLLQVLGAVLIIGGAILGECVHRVRCVPEVPADSPPAATPREG